MPLAIAIARRHARSGEPLEDLVQVAAIGLMAAVDRFDPARGVAFPSFAIPTIEGEVRRHLRDRGSTIRLPRRVQETRTRVLRTRDALEAERGRAVSDEELAAAAGVSADAVAAALSAGRAGAPVPLATDGTAGTEPAAADVALATAEDRLMLAAGFAALDPRERRVLHLRFFAGLSQARIAREVGLSQAHVSRLIRDALAKLRDELGERSVPPGAEISPGDEAVSAAIPPGGADQVLASRPREPTMASMAVREARSLDDYLALPYHVAVTCDEGAGDDERWIARVEELEGCEARGGSAEEATARLRPAMEAWIAPVLARGRPVPTPRSPASHSGRLLLRMPPTLHADLARAAEREGVSLNGFITGALAGVVGWKGHASQVDGDGVPDAAGHDGAAAPPSGSPRTWTIALIVNIAVVALAAIAATVALILAATS